MTRTTYTSAQLKGKKLVINKNKYGVTTGHSVVDKPKKSSSSSRSKPKDVNTGVSEAPRYNPFTNPAPNTSTENGPVYSPPPQVSSSPVPSAGSSNDSRTILQKIGDLIKAPFARNEDLKPVSEDGSFGNRMANANEAIKNALTGRGLTANTGSNTGDVILEAAANNPFDTALIFAGGYNIAKSAISAARAATAETAVSELSKIGTNGLKTEIATTADTVAVNTANAAKTASWLSKAASVVKDPKFVIGTLMTSIGTYPFSGFIKEEALQTLGFSVKTAKDAGRFEDALAATEQIDDVLNPDFWNRIKEGIPFVNVINTLQDFYDAAKTKNEIDKAILNDLIIGQQAGTVAPDGTPTADFYGDIGDQRIATEKEIARIREESKAEILKLEEDARLRGNEQQATYWKGVYEQIDARAAKQSKANEDYWFEYFKNLSNNNSGSSKSSYEPPSNLNFGLL